MSINKSIKKYVYERDNRVCFFCNKKLKFRQISIDHYLPLSKGGTDDVFNLVLSCKKCNLEKKDLIIMDYKDIIISNLKKAVEDNIVTAQNTKFKHNEIIDITQKIYKIEYINNYYVFQSNKYRITVKDNFITKINFIN